MAQVITQETREVVGGYIPYDVPDNIIALYFANGVQLDDKKALYGGLGRIWVWLSMQPNISQGGISISWSDQQRQTFLLYARRCFVKVGDNEGLELLPEKLRVRYGYKGTVL